MDDNIQPFLEGGEKVYSARPLDLEGKTGNSRAEFSWSVTSNNNVKEWSIFYNGQTIIIPNSDPENNDKSYVVDGLEEGDFNFEIKGISRAGNNSLASQLSLSIFGENYRSSLIPRDLSSFVFDGSTATIKFKTRNVFTRNTELKYFLMDGSESEVVVESEENEVALTNIDFSKDINYRTFYVPTAPIDGVETSLDQFGSDWLVLEKPAVEPILNSAKITPILGGLKLTWDNPDLLPIKVNLDYLDINDVAASASQSSESSTGELIISFMKNGTQSINLVFSDAGGNALSSSIDFTPLPAALLDRSGWSSPEQSTIARGGWEVWRMWDGDIDSAWHTPWGGESDYPHWFILDLGATKKMAGFRIARRWDQREVKKTRIEISNDNGTTWTEVGEYTNFNTGGQEAQSYAMYPNPVANMLRVTFLEGVNSIDGVEAVIREFDLLGEE